MNKKPLFPLFFPVFMGIAALTNTLGRPSMENARSVDIISLLGAGMCFGASLVAVVMILRRKL